uniref:Uncharacterized protein n=1 Tax=Trichuris muris TaxID=70415 RepID=A0A5S6R1G2_TRIMR
MEEAIKASAVSEHAIHCSIAQRPNIICRENRFQLRRIKEALFIGHNDTINRDQGVEISESIDTIAAVSIGKTSFRQRSMPSVDPEYNEIFHEQFVKTERKTAISRSIVNELFA